jgi:hypothetical protein
VVAITGVPGAAALAPQAAAPTPFDVFHDLRWLLVYHQSWLAFALEALALVAVRSLVIVTLVGAAWAASVPRPPWRDELRRTAGFVALVAVVLLPFAVLTFGMAVVALSWLFFVAVPVLLMAALLVHRGIVVPGWWRDRPTWPTVRVILVAFVGLCVAGAAISAAPVAARVPLAAIAGVFDAWCWLRLVEALAGAAPQPRRRPFVLVALAGIAALVVGGTAAGFAVSVAVEEGRSALPPVAADATGPPVLIVKGFNSEWDGVTRRWVRGRYRIRRFSYRGLDRNGQPRPYGRADTHQSVPDLAVELGRQVDAFAARTHERVSLVAESEGSVVALAYVAATPRAPVRAVVALSPLLAPGRVFYPPVGSDGWGAAAGSILDGIARALSLVGPVDVSADTPLFRSFVEEGPVLRGLLRCPPPGRREFAVLPLDSGVSAPGPIDVRIRYAVVPAFHGGLLGDHTTAALIRDLVAGRSASGPGFWPGVADAVGALAAGWQAPGLDQGLEPAWRHLPGPDDCAAGRAALRRWIDAARPGPRRRSG